MKKVEKVASGRRVGVMMMMTGQLERLRLRRLMLMKRMARSWTAYELLLMMRRPWW